MNGFQAIAGNAELEAALEAAMGPTQRQRRIAEIANDKDLRKNEAEAARQRKAEAEEMFGLWKQTWSDYCDFVKSKAQFYVGEESSQSCLVKCLPTFFLHVVDESKVENADGSIKYMTSAILHGKISQMHDYLRFIVGKGHSQMTKLYEYLFDIWKTLEQMYRLDPAGVEGTVIGL